MRTCPLIRRIALVVVVLGAGVAHAESPIAYGTRFAAPGFSGTLLLGASGSRAIVEQFIELAGGKRARTVLVELPGEPGGSVSVDQVAGLLDAGTADLVRVPIDDAERLERAVAEAKGVWVTGSGRSVATEDARRLAGVLRACLARGGVVGAAGPVILLIGDDPGSGHVGVIPGMTLGLGEAPTPGYVDLALGPRSALVVRGRRATVLGDGSVHVNLAASPTHPARSRRLGAGRTMDLVALSRAAVARAGAVFPPSKPAPPEVPGAGRLFIGGGGGVTTSLVRQFITAAGGSDGLILVIPTALGESARNGRGDAATLLRAGARRVKILNARTPAEAEHDESLDLLREAGGIWFSGGRQWRLVDAFLDTRAQALMLDMLRRGGAVFGSSAGASIQAGYMVRGHPLGNQVMMAEGYERGLGFLPGVAIDQHFTQRGRHPDLREVKVAYPQLLGIGIDEGTFLVVRGRVATVVGRHRVAFYDRSLPVDAGEREYESIGEGEKYDLVERRRLR